MCGDRPDRVRDADIYISYDRLLLLRYYIVNRYNIHLLKDVYHSDDIYRLVNNDINRDIFMRYKFCNVRREHDRCSRWLISHISDSSESIDRRICRSISFRILNNVNTAELISIEDAPLFDKNSEFDRYIRHVEMVTPKIDDSYYSYFTNAYSTTGMKAALNKTFPRYTLPACPLAVGRALYKSGFTNRILESDSQTDVFNALRDIPGISDFMAYQLFIDLTYIPDFPFSENEFVIAGPGCKIGLGLMIDNNNSGLTDSETLFWMRDNLIRLFDDAGIGVDLHSLFSDLPEYDRCLNVMMLENCMCELQKFYRALSGSGPRVHYHPYKEKLCLD